MQILVTGGSGFLGAAIVRRLVERGDRVRTLTRNAAPVLAELGVDTRCGDLADESAVIAASEACDAVVHVAAKVGAWGLAKDFYDANVRGTENVIAACHTQGVPRLIYTSSPSVVGHGSDLCGVDESEPLGQHFYAHYPRTKAMAERLVRAANQDHLTTVILRPHLIWGPGDTQLFPRLIARAKMGRLALPSGPVKRVDCTYIDNAVDAHIAALDAARPEAACAGRAYFISQGEAIEIPTLINRVLHAAQLPPVTRTINPHVLYALGAVAEASFSLLRIFDREPPMTRFVAQQLCTSHWFNISAARRDLHYAPRVSFDEGMARLAASLQ